MSAKRMRWDCDQDRERDQARIKDFGLPFQLPPSSTKTGRGTGENFERIVVRPEEVNAFNNNQPKPLEKIQRSNQDSGNESQEAEALSTDFTGHTLDEDGHLRQHGGTFTAYSTPPVIDEKISAKLFVTPRTFPSPFEAFGEFTPHHSPRRRKRNNPNSRNASNFMGRIDDIGGTSSSGKRFKSE